MNDTELKLLANEIKILKAQLKEANEALRFYGNVESWNLIHPHHDKKSAKTIVNSDIVLDIDAKREFGGRRARQYLEKWKVE